jgi:hypothetical protein
MLVLNRCPGVIGLNFLIAIDRFLFPIPRVLPLLRVSCAAQGRAPRPVRQT